MSWLMAKVYERTCMAAEKAGLSDWRARLLAGLEGSVLEVGAGTGLNLTHYPKAVTRLVLSEPDRHMRSALMRKRGAQLARSMARKSWRARATGCRWVTHRWMPWWRRWCCGQ